MSTHEIAHACGHEETVRLSTGNRRDRDSRAAWLASRPCDACARAAYVEAARVQGAAARAAVEAEGLRLPDLTGTERQIAWATDLRAQALVDCPPALTELLVRVTEARRWIDARTGLAHLYERLLLHGVASPRELLERLAGRVREYARERGTARDRQGLDQAARMGEATQDRLAVALVRRACGADDGHWGAALRALGDCGILADRAPDVSGRRVPRAEVTELVLDHARLGLADAAAATAGMSEPGGEP